MPDGPTTPTDDLFGQLTHFAGFDWAKRKHHVMVVDPRGQLVVDLGFEDTAEGWAKFREKLSPLENVAVAIETSSGPAVERLLDAGLSVYPLNPKAAKRYRERKAPSGVKSDRLDAWCFAEALRTDGHHWRLLAVQDPLTHELRLLCRDEIALIEQRTALVNQLQAALYEYYPTALQAFDDWTIPSAWAFLEWFPTSQDLAKAGKRRWEKFLHTNKLYRRETYQKRLDLFAGATEFCGGPAVTSAKSLLAVSLTKQLRLLEAQLKTYRERIQQLFDQHPDHDLFNSLPAAGKKLAPRLLAECGDDRSRFDHSQALQCHAGTAPVSFQSGQTNRVFMRRACNKTLRATVHLWCNLSRTKCVWADTYYQQKKQQGMSHACAVRCLGQRWIKIIWKMWQTRTPYDEALHTRNQIRHGSWVIALATPSAKASTANP